MRPLIHRSLVFLTALLLAGCGASQDVLSTPTPAATATPIIIVIVVTATPLPATATPAVATNPGVAAPPSVPTPGRPAATAVVTPPAQSTFRLCATPDPATERAIEQYIAGRSFRATLSSGSNGCDQLAIVPEPGTSVGSGRQSVSLSSDGIKVQIVTQDGVTHVSTSAA